MNGYAWHFTVGEKLRDGTPLELGRTYVHEGDIEICARGYHASWRALDALSYVPGSDLMACLVRVDGIETEQIDKFVCRARTVVGLVHCDEVFRAFARHAASTVLHLWDAPKLVKRYLETGDESIRAAAGDAARAAAWGAAWDVAGNAAWDAARAAAWNAARAAAWNAAWGSAWDAAGAAAWGSVWGDAGAAAWDAAFNDLNAELESMLLGQMDFAPGMKP